MLWASSAIVLSARAFGEGKAIVSVLSDEHGRYRGIVPGGGGKRRSLLQPGTLVSATWRARMADQLGFLTLEPQRGLNTNILGDRLRLATLAAACSLLEAGLPEREPNPALYAHTLAFLDGLAGERADGEGALATYAEWERQLVANLGFAAAPAVDRVAPMLPADIGDATPGPAVAMHPPDRSCAAVQLKSTLSALEEHVFTPDHHRLPAARWRLADLIARDLRRGG